MVYLQQAEAIGRPISAQYKTVLVIRVIKKRWKSCLENPTHCSEECSQWMACGSGLQLESPSCPRIPGEGPEAPL